MSNIDEMRPQWCKEPCWECGIEGYATRTERRPKSEPYICETCEVRARAHEEHQAALAALRAENERLKRELAEWNDADTAEEWLELHAQGFENEGVELARNHAQIIRHQLSELQARIATLEASETRWKATVAYERASKCKAERERDAAQARCAELEQERDQAHRDAEADNAEAIRARGERDALRSQLATVTARCAELERELEAAVRRADLGTAQILAIASVIDGDDKGETRDNPRWTPTLEHARRLRAQLDALTAEVGRLRADCEALIGSPVGAWVSAQEMAERLLLIESAQEQEVAGEEDPELAALRAENERLKGELAAHHDADGILQSQLEAAQLAIDEGKAWRQRCEQSEAQLREAQATIERLKGELAKATHSRDFTQQWYAERLQRLRDLAREMGRERDHCAIVANGSLMGEPPTYAQQLNLAKYRADKAESDLREAQATIERLREGAEALAHEWDNEHDTPETEAVLGTCAIELRNLIDSALASAKPESAKELDRIARDAGAAPPEPAELTVPALPIDERASAEIDKLVSAAGSGKRVQVARPGWVAVGVLRELAHDWENRAACIMADVGEGHQDSIDAERLMACADELIAIADTAGDAEAVERAAFELVERECRRLSIGGVDFDKSSVAVAKVMQDGSYAQDYQTMYDAYRALAGKGGEGESDE